MSAVLVQIADAVAAALTAATLSQTCTVARAYVPVYDLAKDFAAVKLTVVPRETSFVPLSRRDDDFDFVVDVAVQKGVGQGAMTAAQFNTACDPLMQLVQEVLDLFRAPGGASVPATFIGGVNAPVYAPDHLDKERVFTSVLSLRFRLARRQ